MQFSCKISNSVLQFLNSQGEDVGPLLEQASLPEEFLSDSSYWMDAQDMENFLQTTLQLYGARYEGNLLEQIGHAVPKVRSWGVLDSVLRMMPEPLEILAQPTRFLSYFVTPQPPIENLKRSSGNIELDLPITSDQYPLVVEYLRASFEAVPIFSGRPMATCQWRGIHLGLKWENQQSSIFTPEEIGHQLSPDLLRSIVANLEKNQLELEKKNLELQARNEELLSQLPEGPTALNSESIQMLNQSLAKISDYMVRAQQLIVLLIAQDRMSPQVKAAMKKVDWERVQTQFPLTLQQCRDLLLLSPETNQEGDSSHVENYQH